MPKHITFHSEDGSTEEFYPRVPVEEPKPEKLWLKAPFKALSDDGFLNFAKNDLGMNGLNFWSHWSLPYPADKLSGAPCGFEVFTHEITKWSLGDYLGRTRTLIEQGFGIQWIFLDHESPYGWTDESRAWAARFRKEFPGIKIYSGPVGWAKRGPTYNPDVDGQYSFYRISGTRRMWEDIAYILAGANYVKAKALEDYKVFIGVQPVYESGDVHLPADPKEFKKALHIAAHNPDGLILWSADRLWKINADHVEQYGQEAHTVTQIAAAFKAQGEETGRDRFCWIAKERFMGRPWFVLKAMCRVAWAAGLMPVITDNEEYDAVTKVADSFTEAYKRSLILLENNDDRERAGYVGTEGADRLKGEIRDAEMEMAGRLG